MGIFGDIINGLFGSGESGIQKQATQNAQQSYNQGQQYIGQANQGYQQVAKNGAFDTNFYQQNLPALYSKYSNLAQLGNPASAQAQGGARNPAPAAQQSQAAQSPYALTLPQQTQLNALQDNNAQAAQSAIDSYRQSAAARGLPPNPEAEALISQKFSAQGQQTAANFEEQQRQAQLQSAQTLLSLLTGLDQQGTSATSNAASGQAGIGGTELSNANANQNTALSAANSQTNLTGDVLGGLGSLVGLLTGGTGLSSLGIGGGSQQNNTGVNNGQGQYGPSSLYSPGYLSALSNITAGY